MADNVENSLTPDELDTIGEIMNISMGAAATAVSTMLEKQVIITTPRLEQNRFGSIDSSKLEPAIVVKIGYVEGISGTNIIMLRRHDMQIILSLLMGDDSVNADDFEFDDMSMSAACEVMNQMMGASSTALSEILEMPINISTPEALLIESLTEMDDHFLGIRDDEQIVAISFKMMIKDVLDTMFTCFFPISFASSIVAHVNHIEEELPTPPLVQATITQPTPAPVQDSAQAPAQETATVPAQMPVPTQETAAVPVQMPAPTQVMPAQQAPTQAPPSSPSANPAYYTQPPAAAAPFPPTDAPAPPQMPQNMQPAHQAMTPQPIMPQQQFDAQPSQQMQPPQYFVPEGYPPYGQVQPQYAQQPYPYGQMPSPYPPQQASRYTAPPPSIKNAEFPDFSKQPMRSASPSDLNMGLLMGVHLEVSVVIGRAKRKIKDIMDFGQGTVIELDKQTGAPAEIMVNGQLLAYGDIIVVGDNFGVRITEIVGTKELLDSLDSNI